MGPIPSPALASSRGYTHQPSTPDPQLCDRTNLGTPPRSAITEINQDDSNVRDLRSPDPVISDYESQDPGIPSLPPTCNFPQDSTPETFISRAGQHTSSDPNNNQKIDDTASILENDMNSSDDDDGPQADEDDKPRKLTERRVADTLQFQQWFRQRQRVVINTSLQAALDDAKKNPASRRIISSPREYQVELFERAKEKNIIAVLPTGTGKTLVAALLLRHVIEQELMDRNNKDQDLAPRISFFLVDKVSLVHQQWRVLKANLDHNVAKFHGELVGKMVTHKFWDQQFKDNVAIVCTADILLRCLHHSYFRMDQINLIIFDEAHHAKKNHPYSRIIKDFYVDLEKDNHRRPRILGMTASPVDAKTDLATAAAQLEGLLHSEIATVIDAELMRDTSSNQEGGGSERMVEYGLPSEPFETPLWQKLNKLVGKNDVLKRLFTFSKASTRELGRWCADRVWHLCLTPEEILKVKARTERNLLMHQAELPVSTIDARVEAVQEAYQAILDHSLPEIDPARGHLSHKIIALLGIFKQHFRPASDKCIIFVEQRLTATLLTDLLKQKGLPIYEGPRSLLNVINPGALLGSGSGEAGEQLSMTYAEQQRAVQQFHIGDLNVLIATSIAEEGLDIPDCNMIIRFDLYHTMIQYIQSRGRARMKNSKYFHMVEIGNQEHVQRVFDSQEKEQILHSFCAQLPADRILKGNDFDMDFFLKMDLSKRVFNVSSTGAKLTYESSLVVLATFVASLQARADVDLRADYIVKSVGKEFQCQVILPDAAPFKSILGRRASSKQVAKCAAAFDACVKLRNEGAIDEWLNSIHARNLPAMRNAQLALSSKKRAEYDFRVKPAAWSHRGLPDQLYMIVLVLENPTALGRLSRPLAMLTRKLLPRVAKFPIFFGNHHTSVVCCEPMTGALPVSLQQIEALTTFTLRIFHDVFSKEYKPEPEKLPYYFAPLTKHHTYTFDSHCDLSTLVDWDCVTMVHTTSSLDGIDLEGQPTQVFKDRFVTDPHDGSRKFYSIGYQDGLKPSDPEIPGVKGMSSSKSRRNAPNDIWNYSVSMWSKSRSRIKVRDDLPVVEAEYIPLRRNLLDEFETPETEKNHCYIVFATLKISSLPVDIVAMAYNLPAIIHRLESNLIVLEACKGLELDIRPDLALEAMTKDSDNSDEHTAEQINFQKGMGNNYERLEFLGDSFLKMATSVALYSQMPEGDEFIYHVDRMVLICNKNLFNNALDLKLEESIRSKSFNRRTWYPEGLEQLSGKQNTSIKGKKGTGRHVHVLGDKSIADVCEALIGAAYLTGKDQNSFDMAVQAVTKFTNHKLENKHHTQVAYAEYYSAFKVPEWQAAQPNAVHLHLADQIEKQLEYKFTHPRLLRCAFIHPSYSFMYEHIPHYQRLEFLGDALLDMVCVEYLFHRFPGADPQWLTEHKMAMVSNQFLGCLCVSLGFQRHMISMTGGLPQQIAAYVEAITSAQETAEIEAEAANRSRAAYSRNFWTSVVEPPKCLPDIVEAFIGAIFVDSKYDYSQVESFFDKNVRPFFEDMHLYDTFANKHPVTFLSHKLHEVFGCANWRLMVNELPVEGGRVSETQVVAAVMIHGKVQAHAMSASGRYAKIAAAKQCLAILQEFAAAEFKKTFGCDCEAEDIQEDDPSQHATAV
ncbi:hypothetical protein BJ170DRAFT_612321 [Xylariales sp. AK1849]|nr:hypothetical protein BJ170DRAFT_612321 [Xylariales sp. AK1849]